MKFSRELTKHFCRRVVGPVLAQSGDLDGGLREIVRGAVRFLMEHRGLNRTEVADLFQRSERWVYDHLGPGETEDEDELSLEYDVLCFFLSRYPAWQSIGDCVRALRAQGKVAPEKKVTNLVVALTKLGRLKTEGGRYAARQEFVENVSPATEEKAARVANSYGIIVPVSAAYLAGDARAYLARVQVRVTPEAWTQAMQELSEFVPGLIERAVKRTNEQVPDGIGRFLEIKGLVIIGPDPEQQEE